MPVPLIISPTSSLLNEPKVVILDASWLYEPDPPTRNAHEEFDAGPRFPNARFWDLDAVSEPHPDGYALMLPTPERFAAFASKHGVSKDSHVIVYDGEGVFAAPRTAWTFKVSRLRPRTRGFIADRPTKLNRFMDTRRYL
jgi:thiosulfate/3-mercaptopyruvate sulfurtransferase